MKRRQLVKRRQKPQSEPQSWMQVLLVGQSLVEESDVRSEDVRRRSLIFIPFIIVVVLILLIRLFFMQIVAQEQFAILAKGNRIREVVQYAPRGRILDRDGKVLADNTLSFQLSATPYLISQDPGKRQTTFELVASITGLSVAEIERELHEADRDRTQPILIRDQVPREQALKLEARANDIPGFSLDEIPIRSYKTGAGLSPVLGYTGRVDPDDLERDQRGNLLPTDFIGKSGVELSFDTRLRGKNGWIRIEVDALGKPVRVLGQQAPRPGRDLTLALDLKAQQALYNATIKQMKSSKTTRASGVAVDPRNGEVLAMVSLPDYDANLFARGISAKEFEALTKNRDEPLLNKAISGGYTSGSVIKPLVAAAALQEKVVTDKTIIVDRGYIDVVSPYNGQSFRFRGWRPGGLGPMDVRRAIAMSSNIYFYTVGGGFGGQKGLGEERLTKHYRQFGLGEASGIKLPGESKGRVPDEAWKQRVKGEPWYVGDTYNISIGQGDLLISPLQITMANASIANGGYLLQPQMEKGVERVVRRELAIDKKNLQIVREGMRMVLTKGTTCGCLFAKVPHPVAGKTGTAETNTPGGRRPHAWFVAYTPSDQPRMMAGLLIEEGVGGSQYAAPAIAEMMTAYFNN